MTTARKEASMATITRTTTLLMAAMVLAVGVSASAATHRGRVTAAPRGYGYISPPLFDPFWGPYYPYGAYPIVVGPIADVRVQVVPKQTQVFVDGYYAGTAGDFDGVFKRLHTTPGGHAITLYLDGYRTVTRNIYVRPDSTFKLQDTMDKLAAGEVSAPAPLPAQPPQSATQSPAGTATQG